MAAKYHIKSNGDPGICRAQSLESCPRTQEGDSFHGTREQANEEASRRFESEYGKVASAVKSGADVDVSSMSDATLTALAESKEVSSEILDEIARKSKTEGTLWRVATNPGASAETLAYLSEQKKSQGDIVRSAIARHPNTDPAVLRQIMTGPKKMFSGINGSLAKNPNTPADILNELAGGKNVDTRLNILANPSVTPEAVAKISEATYNPSDPSDRSERDLKFKAISHPKMPASALEQLASHEDSFVRRAVAEQASTPLSALRRLSEDSDAFVRDGVDRNPAMA